MRIAVLSDTMWPTPYRYGHGLGRAVYNAALELVARGHQVTLCAGDGSRLPGAERVITSGQTWYAGERELAAWINQHAHRFDCYWDCSHSHSLANDTELPGIAHFMDIAGLAAPCAVFVSRYTRDAVGIPGEIVHNAICPDEFPLWEGERAGALWMAYNVPHKGLDTAKEAARLAGWTLDARGEGTPAGPVYGRRKVRLMQQARVFLFPATMDAGPQTPLEVMACGTPVLALRMGGTPDYVVEGIGGYLCEDAAEMAARLDDLDELGTPAEIRQSVLNGGFVVSRQVDELETLFNRVLAGERW